MSFIYTIKIKRKVFARANAPYWLEQNIREAIERGAKPEDIKIEVQP